ncbi:hypothetical protein [Streptomyces sp. NBC_00557]|uniref:hypothetical protein n=1 Tax=Streptomyces sp. NBC_00557 TaxID=2975776 RepID=UPI002E823D13|nr:hypothetical protein [Streptomyces sp. NBC_00557]WUC34976.1 hypothetical protein OG956_12490 [Streptomyces sp. NBC_00557]
MGSGLSFIFIPLFLYVSLVVILCVKIADNTSWKMGWLFAAALIFFPAGLLTVVGMYESGAW